jgi:hypothetical protein
MTHAHIDLFLLRGDAKRLRWAEIVGWTGKGIAAPRTELDELLARPELQTAGIYILVGTDSDTGQARVYIGEAEVIGNRLKQHRTKDFWISVIVFVSKDQSLTRGHIQYLEAKIITEAKEIGRALLENSAIGGATLPEADTADMEDFLSRVRQLLPVLGSDLLTPVIPVQVGPVAQVRLFCTKRDAEAQGQRTANGFVVFKGSTAVAKDRDGALKHAPWIVALRASLVETGKLLLKGTVLEFQEDIEFTSPSAAAAVICGGSANGLIEWQDASGRTLKAIDEAT